MTARNAILRRVRAAARHRVPHPPALRTETAPRGEVLWPRFGQMLRSVGGEAVGPVSQSELEPALRDLCAGVGAGRIIAEPSCGLGEGPWEELLPDVSPRTLADVDIAVLPGSIGVAENAAVAVEGKRAPARALAFLCQQLVLILDLDAIVPDMHEAILRMPPDATRFHHFTWVSGPSKTADIEQVLVLGAHGPRSLVVVGRRTQ